MKFNRSLDWLKESDEDDNLLADDELDAVEEEMNEGLYVDPSNYDKHKDLVDVVDKAGNPQKMTQATYDKNKDSGEFEKKEPEKKEVKAGQKVDARDLKEGSSYVTKEDMYYGDVEEFDGIYDIDELKKKGFVKDNEVVIPAGTKLNYEGFNGGAYTFDINGEEFDLSLDDIDLYSAEEPEDTSSKETTKQTEGLPIDPNKYPELANKVDKVNPELQQVSDNLYEDFYHKNTSEEARHDLKKNLLNKFKDYDDNEIASSLLNLPTVGQQDLAIDALSSLAYLDVNHSDNFSKDDKRLYDISKLASEMYYQQSQYNKDAVNHEKISYWTNKGVATNNKGMVKASSFSNIKQKDLDERLTKEKRILVADGSRLLGIEKDSRDDNKYYIGTVNKEGYNKAVIGNYNFEDLKALLSNKKDVSDKANKATLDRAASFSKDR